MQSEFPEPWPEDQHQMGPYGMPCGSRRPAESPLRICELVKRRPRLSRLPRDIFVIFGPGTRAQVAAVPATAPRQWGLGAARGGGGSDTRL